MTAPARDSGFQWFDQLVNKVEFRARYDFLRLED